MENDTPNTHQKINPRLCGKILEMRKNWCRIGLELTKDMVVDSFGLIHGGFIFGLADHTAMIAVNHPNVVLGGANVQFLKPVVVGDYLIAEPVNFRQDGKKIIVKVKIIRDRNRDEIFLGEFICFTPKQHICEKLKK